VKQPWQLLLLPVAIGLAVVFLSSPGAYARGRGGGFARGGFDRGGSARGGFERGDFFRGGPAATGSFASREGLMRGNAGGFQASRQQYASGAQANRMQYGENAQASRQQEANGLQSSREQTAQSMQSSAQQYRGSYPYAGYPAWDAGAGLAAATAGAAIGAAAAAPMTAPSSAGPAYAAAQPCADPVAVPLGEMTFFRCGSTWYRQAFGPAGPVFVPVRRPGM
jgi:hypothetical protein